MNENKSFILLLIQVTEDYKIIQLKRLLQTEIVIFPHLILTVNYFLQRW